MYIVCWVCAREIKLETVVSSQRNSPSETLERKCKAAENKIFELQKVLQFKVGPVIHTYNQLYMHVIHDLYHLVITRSVSKRYKSADGARSM